MSTSFFSVNPAVEEPIEEIQATPPETIRRQIRRADQAQEEWAEVDLEERVDLVEEFASSLKDHVDELAQLMTREQGKPISEAQGEVNQTVYRIRYLAERAQAELTNQSIHLDDTVGVIEQRPYGVVAGITPWNYPVSIPIWIMIPALLAGNAVVFKPSELTPVLGEKLHSYLPDPLLERNLVPLVQGGATQGKAIVQATEVRSLAFVGSYDTGTGIMARSAEHVRDVGLELGGKDPVIMLPEADLEQTINIMMVGGFKNCGQVCCGFERALVPESRADEVLEALGERVQELTIAPGDEDPDLGPMVRDAERTRVRRHVEEARQRGAKVIEGGPVPEGSGYWVAPAVLGDADPSMAVMNEETFGPILPVWSYQNLDEAISEANRLEYGLGASIIGNDTQAMKSVASQVEAGNIGLNQPVGSVVEFPWGGVKHSGVGRMLGPRAIRRFTEDVTLRWNQDEYPETD